MKKRGICQKGVALLLCSFFAVFFSAPLPVYTFPAGTAFAAAAKSYGYVSGSSVRLREGANLSSVVITTLSKGTKLEVTEKQGDWTKVVYQGKTAYIASQFLAGDPLAAGTSSSGAGSGQSAAGQNAGGGTSATAQASEVGLNSSWKYADFSKISSGKAVLYKAAENRKNIVVAVNAGHGTKGGSSVKTLCHPDGTPKVTGGTTGAGATTAVAVSGGMTFKDGTSEAAVTLQMARALRDVLLKRGYDVLMLRDGEDVQLDNVARSVIANNMASCHIALHWDSTESDKGAYYMSVPNVSSYRKMEPVASAWEKHHALGDSLIAGLKGVGVKIYSGGRMEMDLTQTSYSSVASVAIELGDRVSDHSAGTIANLAAGLADGVDAYFGR